MATKKTAAKKSATSTAKSTKAPAKKAPAKKTTSKRPTSKKAVSMQSFRIHKETQPFMSFQPSIQTAYWLIIAIIAIGFTAWTLNVQANITDLYNQIELLQASEISLPIEQNTAN